jgi:hypothetical protein
MANSEPDFNIDTTTIQEDEWVIYLKILIDNFASMFFSLLSACPKQDVFISLQDTDWIRLFNDVDTL